MNNLVFKTCFLPNVYLIEQMGHHIALTIPQPRLHVWQISVTMLQSMNQTLQHIRCCIKAFWKVTFQLFENTTPKWKKEKILTRSEVRRWGHGPICWWVSLCETTGRHSFGQGGVGGCHFLVERKRERESYQRKHLCFFNREMERWRYGSSKPAGCAKTAYTHPDIDAHVRTPSHTQKN